VRITGNPGIGKSLFATYILYRLLLDRVQHTPFQHFSIVYENQAAEYRLVLSTDGTLHSVPSKRAVEPLLMDTPSTFYIFDASVKHLGESSQSLCRTIVLSSPDVDNYKEWSKRHEQRLHMPEWSLEELQQAFPRCLTVEQRQRLPTPAVIEERYHLVGGIARRVFSTLTTEQLTARLRHEINTCELHKVAKAGESLEKLKGTSHWVLCYNVSTTFSAVGMKPVSSYVCQQLVRREEAKAHDDLVRFLRDTAVGVPRAGTLRGYLFEEFAHQALQRGGEFLIRALKGADVESTRTVRFSPSTARSISDTESIQQLLQHEYGKPTSQNFATVDAVLKPNSLFQMTIRDRHAVNVNGLNRVITGLLTPEPDSKRLKGGRSSKTSATTTSSFDFYFVVPSAPVTLFRSYKLPNISDESTVQGNVQYYALQLPLGADEGRVPREESI
jgi:hypothetical protein